MKYTAFIWDFDGTLFDSYPHIAVALERLLDRYGIAFDHETVMERLTTGFHYAEAEYGLSAAQYQEFLEASYSWSIRPMLKLFPGTAAVLRSVCENGGRNFLYTHRNRTAWTYLRLFGIDRYFSGGVDSTMHFPSKPAPDAVSFLLRQYTLDPTHTVMIGDREIDVLAGVRAGSVGCRFLSHPVRETETAAEYTVHSMAELAAQLEIPLCENDMLTEADSASLRRQAVQAAQELCEAASLRAGQMVVVGCSSSEITGERIGSASSPEAAQAVFDGLSEVFRARGIFLAAQCCEHLNRALILEREAAAAIGAPIVNVVPMPKAGGSFAAAAWEHFSDPVAVAEIRADAGLDIGGTLIGMHLKRVAVPLRLSVRQIGQAAVSAARVRPPFAGGERAVYADELM